MSLDGQTFCYCNPLRRQNGTPLLNHDTPRRLETLSCYCCPPSVARTIAKSAWWAYGVSEDTVWVNLYGASELNTTLPDGATVELTQTTGYPWDGAIAIRIAEAPDRPLTLRMRVPGWADRASLTVNGQVIDVKQKPGTYAEVKRSWAPGDTVNLALSMVPVLVEANPLVESAWGQVATMRGPLVYCAESMDLPQGVAISDIRLPRNATWTERRDPNLLDGVVVLETEALAGPSSAATGGLYRRLAPGSPEHFRLTMIPYFAWNNRSETEMTVWIPAH
jgi:DUF1680 family protein